MSLFLLEKVLIDQVSSLLKGDSNWKWTKRELGREEGDFSHRKAHLYCYSLIEKVADIVFKCFSQREEITSLWLSLKSPPSGYSPKRAQGHRELSREDGSLNCRKWKKQ
jgi:hypothetical protein